MNLENLNEKLDLNDVSELKEQLLNKNSVELVKKLENLSIEDICEILYLVGSEKSGELFSYFSNELKENLILNLDNKFIREILNYTFTDDIIEFLDETNETVKEKILTLASNKRRLQLNMQLTFKENSAGSIMSVDFVKLNEYDTSIEALNKIKSQEKIAETISYCYITNDQNILIGCISMRDVLLAPEKSLIKDLMETDIISVDIDDDQEKVSQIMSKYDLLAIPVVNDHHHILGIITVDDIMDIIEDEITEDIHKMGGISHTEGSYLEMSAFKIAKSRIFWLLILMISGTISGLIIGNNSNISVKLPSLLLFIPMIMDTAGNAGSQSSAMVVRGIVVDNLSFKDINIILKKEFINSLILGLILFIVNILRIMIFMNNIPFHIALIVSLTIYIIVLVANIIGGILPIIGERLKLDPASMSGPVLTTMCDAISLSIYFLIASIYLGGAL